MRFVIKWYKTVVSVTALMLLCIYAEASYYQLIMEHLEEENSECVTEFTSDGPYVFYKKGLLLVRSLERSPDGGLNTKKEIYTSKEELSHLTCKVDDESQATFKVKLHSNYKVPPSTYPQPEKLLALADIEGNFEAFATTLKGNKVINEKFEWTFGKGHLVLVGDFFDRGNNVTEVLWLIYELERQAAEQGGMVHFIIGNHEEMNLRGDSRYVEEKYFEVARAFKTKYTALFASNTELGKWLRSKNVIERIGQTLFVHGGFSPELASSHMSLKEINKIARNNFGKAAWRVEQNGGMAKRIFGDKGPMWYRGYFTGVLKTHELIHVLNIYKASKVVVGHTIVPNVSSIFDGRVIAVDVKHCTALEDGTTNALLVENDNFYAVNVKGQKSQVYPMLTKNEVVKVFSGIRENNTDAIDHFLKNGNNINKFYSSKQYTLLHYAIKNDKPDIVDYLLDKGASLEQTFEEQTPLMYAIKLQKIAIADILVAHGADVESFNKHEAKVLFYCAKYGDLKTMKFLIAHGANPKIKDRKGHTPIHYAFKTRQYSRRRLSSIFIIFIEKKIPFSAFSFKSLGTLNRGPCKFSNIVQRSTKAFTP